MSEALEYTREYQKKIPDADLVAGLQRNKPELYKAICAEMDPLAMTAAGRAKFQTLSDHESFLATMATPSHPTDPVAIEHLNDAGRSLLRDVIAKLKGMDSWSAPDVSAKLKETVAERKVKMPQVMMPFRVALTGQLQTPAIDAIAAALRKDVALGRLERAASD